MKTYRIEINKKHIEVIGAENAEHAKEMAAEIFRRFAEKFTEIETIEAREAKQLHEAPQLPNTEK